MTERLHVTSLLASSQLLAGFSAVITGAGSAGQLAGIGAATAVRLAQAGATVVLVDLDNQRLKHTAEAILRTSGREPLFVSGDLKDLTTIDRVAAALEAHGLGVDVLVNSAGIAPDESAMQTVEAQNGDGLERDALWASVFEVNLMSAVRLTERLLPAMRSGGGGAVVNVTSVAASRGGGGPAYSASKAALESVTRTIAHREGPFGVRVNSVSPGHLLSPMGLIGANGMGAGSSGRLQRTRAAAGLIRGYGDAWDVADAVLFLASPNSSYITGSTIYVDGGTTQTLPLSMWERIAREADSDEPSRIDADARESK